MRRKWLGVLLSSLLITSIGLTACSRSGNEASPSVSSSNSTTNESPANESNSAADPASSEAPADPLGKIDPPITVSAARWIDPTLKFLPGEDISNNVWTREFESKLGIKINYDWTTAKQEDYTNKLNVSIASGDKLPELFLVDATQLQRLVDADQVADLTEAWNKYASEDTKKVLLEDGGIAMSASTFNGKFMAVPFPTPTITSNDVLWLREDWLKKVNLPAPKTVEELQKVLEAFVKNDPDGNGKADTLGLGAAGSENDALYKNGIAGDLGGMFAAYKAYPDRWVKDASGNIVFGSIQPETKQALAKLQELFKAGLLDKEFALKNPAKMGEDVIANKTGAFIGANWNVFWPLDITKNQKLVDLKPYSLVSVDGSPALQAQDYSVRLFTVMRKDTEHPEAIVKLLNLYMEHSLGKNPGDDKKFGRDPVSGVEFFAYPLVRSGRVTADIPEALDAVRLALKNKDESVLTTDGQKSSYALVKSFYDGDILKGWGGARQFDAFDIIKNDNLGKQVKSEFYGAPTPGMVANKATLDKLQLEVFAKIIMNAAPVDDFDKFVEDWKKLGGEQMTKEVNEWSKQHN